MRYDRRENSFRTTKDKVESMMESREELGKIRKELVFRNLG